MIPEQWSAEVNSADIITRVHNDAISPLEPLVSYSVELIRLSGIVSLCALIWLLCRVWP